MKKLFLIALLIWSAGTASATAYTANTTGPWNVAATWSGVGVPGSGDTAKINNGVTVTCPVSVTCTIGLAAASNTTEALGCTDATATGTGIFINNGTFVFKGVVNICNGTWSGGAGSIWTADSSANPTFHYAIVIGLNNGTAAKLDASAGTSGSHITFNIAGGSGYGGGTHGTSCASGCGNNGSWYCTYCDVSDWGGNSASFRLAEFSASTASGAATDGFGWSNSNCVRCGQVDSWNNGARSDFFYTGSAAGRGLYTAPNLVAGVNAFIADGSGSGINVTLTTGTRSFAGAVIVGGISLFSSSTARGSSIHFTASGTIFESICGASGASPINGNHSYQWDTFTNVIVYNCTTPDGNPSSMPGGTNLTRVIFLYTGNTTNAHFMASIVAGTTLVGCVAQLEGNQTVGGSNADLFQTQEVPVARFAVNIKNCLSLPDGGGFAIGTFTNHSDTVNCDNVTTFCPQITVENNTFGCTDSSTLAIGAAGEVNTGFSGLYASQRNNLCYYSLTGTTFNAGIAWLTKWHTSVSPAAGTFANADYNGFINATAGAANRYFRSVSDATEYTVTPPGAHDVSVATNPFVAPTRNFQTWCQTLDGAATTFAACMADINAGTISTTQVFATTTGAYDWIRAGWAITGSTTLKAAGYDGSDIGAVPWVAGCVQAIPGPAINNCGANSIGELIAPRVGTSDALLRQAAAPYVSASSPQR